MVEPLDYLGFYEFDCSAYPSIREGVFSILIREVLQCVSFVCISVKEEKPENIF